VIRWRSTAAPPLRTAACGTWRSSFGRGRQSGESGAAMGAEAAMAKRTNRLAWGLAGLLLIRGGWLLV
jgi:hypothetical protein